jgi:hypothetical protein
MSDWIQSADGTETIREDHDAVIRRLSALVDSECRRAEEAHGRLQRASLEIERLRSEREWRPIETVPKDGTSVLVCGDYDAPHVAAWYGHRWISKGCDGRAISSESDFGIDYQVPGPLTHWQPLPAPPEDK